MSDLIEAIYLDSTLGQYSTSENVTDDEDKRRLGSLGKINLFVGANNSGKSRLMRLLAAAKTLKVVPRKTTSQGLSFDEMASDVRRLGEDLRLRIEQYRQDTRDSELSEIMKTFRFLDVPASDQPTIFDRLQTMSALEMRHYDSYEANVTIPFRNQLRELTTTKWSPVIEIAQLFARIPESERLYIPTLRSLRDINSTDIYDKQTRDSYFKDAKHVRISSGLQMYDEVMSLFVGDHDQRERLVEFEQFVGDSFFEGRRVSLIPKKTTTTNFKELTIKVGTEKEYLVRELGDGIQSILILTFPLFVQGDRPLLAFIEEPELFMHPWLQRVFLKLLSKRFPSHQYFLTTHSNHFLDLTLDVEDVSVFTLEKELDGGEAKQQQAKFKFTRVSGGDRRPLELLGVRNSSVFLSNCTIWVEGITDRRYLAHWLELYQQQLMENRELDKARWFKEDLHYSFVEYAGANLCHWSLLDETGPNVDRLCSRLFLIADSDGATETSAKGKNHQRLRNKLGDDFYLLPAKEIENLTKPEVLTKILIAYGEDEVNIKPMNHKAYLDKPLGKFIDDQAFKDIAAKKRRGSYANEKTISDKTGFCAKAVVATTAWNDVSDQAQGLAKRVFEFIRRHNPRD